MDFLRRFGSRGFALWLVLCSCRTKVDDRGDPVINAYLVVGGGLVTEDLEKVRRGAMALSEASANRHAEPLTVIHEQAQGLASGDLPQLREVFRGTSETVIGYIQANPALQPGLLVAYCPMAFENTGALWVQAEGKLENPYFGDAMLRCGTKYKWDAELPHREPAAE